MAPGKKWVIMCGRERLEITFAPDVWARLERISRTYDLPIGVVINHALAEGLKALGRPRTRAEFFRRAAGARPSNGRRK